MRRETASYPAGAAARNRWVLARRGPKNLLDPWRPYAMLWEEEADAGGDPISTLTVFLTNNECPYRCLMCDLWKNTLDAPTPPGAIPSQIAHAIEQLPPAERDGAKRLSCRQIKLYNAGSFFDPRAIPPQDDPAIAAQVAGFERVIVECHPALLGARCLRFRKMLAGRLEVAIGLETVHPEALARLNKRFTVDDFRRAAAFLAENGMDLRVFLLVRPPFLNEEEGVLWTQRSLDLAFDCGASVCCLIPTRAGNGAMETLAASDEFAPPSLTSLETAQEYGLRLRRGRVFADLWDIEKFFTCACSPARAARLETMNRMQTIPPPISCGVCGR